MTCLLWEKQHYPSKPRRLAYQVGGSYYVGISFGSEETTNKPNAHDRFAIDFKVDIFWSQRGFSLDSQQWKFCKQSQQQKQISTSHLPSTSYRMGNTELHSNQMQQCAMMKNDKSTGKRIIALVSLAIISLSFQGRSIGRRGSVLSTENKSYKDDVIGRGEGVHMTTKGKSKGQLAQYGDTKKNDNRHNITDVSEPFINRWQRRFATSESR